MFQQAQAVALTAFFALSTAASADDAKLDRLVDALGLPDVLAVMQSEGIDYGGTIRDDLFPGRGGIGWDVTVQGIYDYDKMLGEVRNGIAERLSEDSYDPLLTFFESTQGQAIISLEVSAREALVDEDVEELANQAYADLNDEGGPRLEQLQEFVAVNDLVESNVMGAMNSNFAFYVGLMDGSAFEGELTEDQILRDVWAQEDNIRADSTEWVYSFLTLAYQSLHSDDLDAYIALSGTDAGQELNAALFGAFDDMYVRISRELGLAAAGELIAQDI